MEPISSVSSTTKIPTAHAPLVRHTVRQDWGRALLLWHREQKRAYQFEDGKVRVFADRFEGMLRPASRPDPVLRQQLHQKAVDGGHVEPTTSTAAAASATPTLDDQVAVFEAVFEDGFHGNAWTDAHRSRTGKKPLKRHRDPAIATASERLHLDALRMLVEAGNPANVMHEVLAVVKATDLATRAQIDAFSKLAVDRALAHALIDFLHDIAGLKCGPLDQLRLELARAGMRQVPWTTLTAARALVHPQTHVYVRPSVFRAQLKLVAPAVKLSSVPTPEVYARCLEVALNVKSELETMGFQPRDLFDVADFMRVTTSRTNRDALTAAMAKRRAAQQPAVDTRPAAPARGEMLH